MAARMATVLVPLAALVLGGGITAAAATRVGARDRAVAAARFEWRSRAHLAAIQRAVDADVVLVEAVAGVFNASERVTRGEFVRFLRDIVARRTDVTAVEWAPAVSGAERSQLVAEAAADGLPGFDIRARGADGTLGPAPVADRYAPVWFVVPQDRNEAALGFDLTSEPARAEALARACDEGSVVATRPISLVQSSAPGFLVVQAVFRGGEVPATVEGRRAALAGWAVATVDLSRLVSSALTAAAGGGIRATVYDGEGRALLDAETSGGDVRVGEVEAAPPADGGPMVELALELPGQEVRTVFRPAPAVAESLDGGAIRVGLAGGAVSLVLAGWLYTAARRAEEIGRLNEALEGRVAERTRELQATADRLSAEARERARAEAAERIGRAHLDALLRQFPGAVWAAAVVAGGEVAVTSAAGAQVGALGWGSLPRTLADDAGPLGGLAAAHRAAAGGEASTLEIEREGRVFEVRVTPAVGLGEGVTIGVALDVTERRRLEAERMEAHLLRAQKLESLGVLAGGIAHDFNNLLVGIIGNASLLELRLREGGPEMELLHRIEAAGQQAAVLTRQMLAYSGRGHFVIEPTDVNAVVRELGELVLASVSKRITLEWALAPALPSILADIAQIRQVFLNLVTNAADALGTNAGRVRVATRVERLDAARLATTLLGAGLPEADYVLLEVSDTGCGMDAETVRRMFDPFFTTKATGHGLGLAAALGILRGHHGTVEVHSVPGEGTTIRAWFPAAAARPAAASEVAPATAASSLRVLVVDDEAGVRALVVDVLEARGDRVVAVGSGEEALARLHEDPTAFDVVILDLTLPGMDGGDVLVDLLELRPDLPVLVSSGYTEREVPRRTGVRYAGFLQKPYTLQALRAAVDGVAGRG